MPGFPRPVLVLGATGRHGGTGATVVQELVAQNIPVRALVRSHDERAIALEKAGAEIVTGALYDRRSLLGALEGVKRAYLGRNDLPNPRRC